MRWVASLLLLGFSLGVRADVPYKRYCTEQVCIQRHEYAGIELKDVTTHQSAGDIEHRVFRFDDNSVVSVYLSPLPAGTCKAGRVRIMDVASGIAAGRGCIKSHHGMTDMAVSVVLRARDLDTVSLTRRAGLWLWRVGRDSQGNDHEFASEVTEVRFDQHSLRPSR